MGDVVILGWGPTEVFAADTVSAIVASVGCFGVPGLRGAFCLGCGAEGLEIRR